MNAKITKTPRVKAAIALSKRNSSFRMNVWHIKQKAHTAKRIVASYMIKLEKV